MFLSRVVDTVRTRLFSFSLKRKRVVDEIDTASIKDSLESAVPASEPSEDIAQKTEVKDVEVDKAAADTSKDSFITAVEMKSDTSLDETAANDEEEDEVKTIEVQVIHVAESLLPKVTSIPPPSYVMLPTTSKPITTLAKEAERLTLASDRPSFRLVPNPNTTENDEDEEINVEEISTALMVPTDVIGDAVEAVEKKGEVEGVIVVEEIRGSTERRPKKRRKIAH
ncbi:hypothetical protein HDV00_007138 [Rhizophlyctis rosea]|nr:hypothetical protein HDV00_007138 [Rhizophlyctis rosea]